MKKFLWGLLIIALAGGIFYAGFWTGQKSIPSIEKIGGITNKELNKPANVDFGLFWDAWAKVQEKFVNRSNLDSQKMVYGAVSGMVKSLGDPYTVFLSPELSKQFNEDIKGSFDGIGAEIGIRKDVLTIIAPLEGSPAQKAGLLAGDQILKINATSTVDLTIDEAVNFIRGPKGSLVTLTIFRSGWNDPKDFKIIRDTIQVPVIKYQTKIEPNGKKIAYVQLYQFTENAGDEFKKTANQILNSSAEGIILDLRNNPGGYLEVAVDIASWFLGKDQVVVIEDYGNGNKRQSKSLGYNKLGQYSVVVLINEGSASASEILAGALRDNRGIKLVGNKSFGKGSVQELEPLDKGASLKVTIAKWLTPSGHSIADEGLEPDVKVDRTQEDIDANRDPQLDKAMELLR